MLISQQVEQVGPGPVRAEEVILHQPAESVSVQRLHVPLTVQAVETERVLSQTPLARSDSLEGKRVTHPLTLSGGSDSDQILAMLADRERGQAEGARVPGHLLARTG